MKVNELIYKLVSLEDIHGKDMEVICHDCEEGYYYDIRDIKFEDNSSKMFYNETILLGIE